MRVTYVASEDETAVLCKHRGIESRTYLAGPENFPIDARSVAKLLNDARLAGYRECQSDMRAQLGLSEH